jgi:hypothetical protein
LIEKETGKLRCTDEPLERQEQWKLGKICKIRKKEGRYIEKNLKIPGERGKICRIV